jgi:hypothetical protein
MKTIIRIVITVQFTILFKYFVFRKYHKLKLYGFKFTFLNYLILTWVLILFIASDTEYYISSTCFFLSIYSKYQEDLELFLLIQKVDYIIRFTIEPIFEFFIMVSFVYLFYVISFPEKNLMKQMTSVSLNSNEMGG